MRLPIYQIDAFTGKGLRGNPAAVVPLETAWPDTRLLQLIAEENNLSETAFIVHEGQAWRMRWFTPTVEVRLCGHATLAAAFALWEHLGATEKELRFVTRSGQLATRRQGDLISIQLPECPYQDVPSEVADAVWQALGVRGSHVMKSNYLFAVLERELEVRALRPNLDAVRQLPAPALAVTAPGEQVDFVSRFFAPALGVDEDPVTGSAHCTLSPYWTSRLGRPDLHALQLSPRGGELFCSSEAGMVVLSGRACTYMVGEIRVPPL